MNLVKKEKIIDSNKKLLLVKIYIMPSKKNAPVFFSSVDIFFHLLFFLFFSVNNFSAAKHTAFIFRSRV